VLSAGRSDNESILALASGGDSLRCVRWLGGRVTAISEIPDLEKLMSNRRHVEPGEIIFLEGQDGDCAYVVLKGEVQVSVNEADGQLVVINRIHAGEMFGEIALLQEGCKRTATALSKDGCELLVIDKGVFDSRLNEADSFLRYVIGHLCRLVLLWTDRVRSA
jgi:CRP/FNR family cyclic AMP-dependent transcriptional regulator